MPTRKDNTNVAPIYRQQQFIPFKGAKKIMWDAIPKINGRRIASGAIDIVSPEFDLLTGIRGLANMVRPKTYKSIINNTDYNPAISELDNAVNKGIQMGRDYINNPIVQSTLEHNRQLYKRLFGKPQNMIYIDKTGKKVLAKERGELLNNAVSYPIRYKFGKLPKKVSGEYNRSKDMSGNITIAENLSPSITKHSAFHETLHHGAYGNYDGIIYDLKAEKLFPNNSYLQAGHEAAANTAEVGRDMGLALGQKYPGRQVFRDMLDNLLAKPYYKDFVIKDAKLDTNRDYKRFWDALTGKYFTTAGATATGLTLTNNDKMKYGGRTKARFGLEDGVPTQEEYIAQQIAAKRAAALDKSRNRTESTIPLVERKLSPEEINFRNRIGYAKINQLQDELIQSIDNKQAANIKKEIDKELANLKKTTTLCQGASCIYTATDNYGKQYRVSGNQTFAANPSKYGFKEVSNDSIQPSDIVQFVDRNVPYHAVIYDSKDDKGENLYNYSDGGYGAKNIKIKKHMPGNNYKTYTFVGTSADSTQWINEYKQKYGNGMRCGGRRKAEFGINVQYGGRAIPIGKNIVYFDGNSHAAGGIGVGNDLEVEGGEVGERKGNSLRVFSAVPFLQGFSPAQLVMGGANPDAVFKAQENFKDRNRINDDGTVYKAGGIYIKPSKRGTFTAAATKRGMGVQEFANKVLANKEDYSPAMVKKANFARNASRWKKEFGGSMLYTINGNVKNGLMSTRPKAQYGKEKKINNDTKIGEDGLIYTRAIDGDWYTDGTRYEDSKYYMGRKSAQQYSREKIKSKPKTQTLDEVVVTAERPKAKEEKKVVTTSASDDNKITTETIEGVQADYPENKSSYKPFTYKKDKDGKLVKVYSDDDTRMNNAYVRVDREGANYKPKSYNPLTGETVNEDGVVETSTPSINGTTKIGQSSTPRGRGTKSSKPTTSTKPAAIEAKQPKLVERPKENLYITGVKNNAVKGPLMVGMEKISAKPASSSTGGGTQPKDGNWIPQYNLITGRDWLGVGTNLAGHIASYFANRDILDRYPMPTKPVMAPAVKLKTRVNINPDLTNSKEAELIGIEATNRNTSSSKTTLARNQRIMNESRDARNKLYAYKENAETQLINQDRLNRQGVYARNVAAHNDWLNKTFVAKTNKLLAKQQNFMSLINGIPMAVNNVLGNIESRKSTNDMIRAIAAPNPNADGRLLGIGDYYTQRLADGRTAVYNKKHKLIKYE